MKEKQLDKVKEVKDQVFQVLSKYREHIEFANGYMTNVPNETILDIERDLKELWGVDADLQKK